MFIKTQNGEWFNPALIKHFSIEQRTLVDGRKAYCAFADGLLLKSFPYEIFYVEDENGKLRVAPDCDEEKILNEAYSAAEKFLAELAEQLNGGTK